jgi:hypothetical protein
VELESQGSSNISGVDSVDTKVLEANWSIFPIGRGALQEISRWIGGFDRDGAALKTDFLRHCREKSAIFMKVPVFNYSLRSGLGIFIENSPPIHGNSEGGSRECQSLRLVGGACSHERTLLSVITGENTGNYGGLPVRVYRKALHPPQVDRLINTLGRTGTGN